VKTIRLENIQRIFQVGDETVHALHDVTLDIAQGEYISIMGPSGSGKSTLLNILGLLDRPNAGVYQLEGMNTTELNDLQQAEVRRHKIGFVFQFFHLIPRLTASENVELPMVLAGAEPGLRKQRVREALERLGLSDRANHRPDQLSGGQRQRVAIARATIMKPAIILADEPTGNLDRVSGSDVVETIEALHRDGMTVVMVTHDPDLGRRARRAIRMVDGQITSDSGDQG
jgi:putative ABC transport system ATP-binding protein